MENKRIFIDLVDDSQNEVIIVISPNSNISKQNKRKGAPKEQSDPKKLIVLKDCTQTQVVPSYDDWSDPSELVDLKKDEKDKEKIMQNIEQLLLERDSVGIINQMFSMYLKYSSYTCHKILHNCIMKLIPKIPFSRYEEIKILLERIDNKIVIDLIHSLKNSAENWKIFYSEMSLEESLIKYQSMNYYSKKAAKNYTPYIIRIFDHCRKSFLFDELMIGCEDDKLKITLAKDRFTDLGLFGILPNFLLKKINKSNIRQILLFLFSILFISCGDWKSTGLLYFAEDISSKQTHSIDASRLFIFKYFEIDIFGEFCKIFGVQPDFLKKIFASFFASLKFSPLFTPLNQSEFNLSIHCLFNCKRMVNLNEWDEWEKTKKHRHVYPFSPF